MQQQKIIPNLWFDHNAKEAVDFYASVFPDSGITHTAYYPAEGLPDFQQEFVGKELAIDLVLAGYNFAAINAGPEFKPTPAISFMLNFDSSRDQAARERLDQLWAHLMEGGQALMPLDTYDFSEHYGWVMDRYGYSWQLMLTNPSGDPRPFIIPSLMFCGEQQNMAESARQFYLSIFKDSRDGMVAPYAQDTGPAASGAIMFSDFKLENQWFTAMDSGVEQSFTFNEAVSLSIACEDQAEIDYYWDKLSAHPQNEQCGWLKDKYGVSWQVVPSGDVMNRVMQSPAAYQLLMEQKKIIIHDLENAR